MNEWKRWDLTKEEAKKICDILFGGATNEEE